MAYNPFQPRIFPLFILYFFIIIFSAYITIKLFVKWRINKSKDPLYLSLVFTFLTLACVMLLVGMTEAVVTGYFKEIYRFTFPLAYCMVVIADIFLFLFASNITNKAKKALVPIIIIGAVLIVALLLPWNWWGVPTSDYKGELNIRLYTTSSFAAFSITIYISIAIICYNTKKQSNIKIVRVGLSLLFYSMISFILFFVMVTIDNMLIVLIDHPGYSIFVYIGWVFTIIFEILSYLSLVMPDWLIKRINKKDNERLF